MLSLSNSEDVEPVSEARTEPSRRDSYLDAARTCILDMGWRRSTLTEVARRAGVSRMTIYRTWPDMDSLLADLMTRELTRLAAQALHTTPASVGDLAETFVHLVRALRTSDLFTRIVEVDPELLLPYLLERPGRSQVALLDVAETMIRLGQEAGWVRTGDPGLLARTLLLAGHGFVLSSHTFTTESVTAEDLDHALTDLITRSLAP